MTDEITIIKEFVNGRMPRFAPKYDPSGYLIYSNLNADRISKYMSKNWRDFYDFNKRAAVRPINFYKICETTSSKVLDELGNVLFDVIKNYFDEYPDLVFNEDEMLEYLKIHLDLEVTKFIFRKTANTSTPYGFI